MIELHSHLGGGVPGAVLWEVLQDEGMSTDFKTFDALQASLTPDPEKITSLDDFLGSFFHTTELIQSSPRAMEASCYHMVAKAYRRSRSETQKLEGIEIRFNPVKRIRDGFLGPDAIMEAAVRGLTRASSHYGVKTGLILTMGRDMTPEENRLVLRTAIRWRDAGVNKQIGYHGVVGIDVAGPESGKKEYCDEWVGEMAEIYGMARDAGLGTTYHVGETWDTGGSGVERVIGFIKPDRIGHGIRAAESADSLDALYHSGTVLEICPSVNLLTRAATKEELGGILRVLLAKEVPFVVCTDNPYLAHTNLTRELAIADEISGQPVSEWSAKCESDATFLR